MTGNEVQFLKVVRGHTQYLKGELLFNLLIYSIRKKRCMQDFLIRQDLKLQFSPTAKTEI